MSKKQSHYIQGDLIILLTLFICVSLLSIYNAQQLEQYKANFVLVQLVWFIVGIGIVVAIQFFDLDQYYRASLIIYIASVLLLVVLWAIPSEKIVPTINGARSWIKVGGFTLQPSELTKIGLIVYLAAIVNRHRERFKESSMRSDLNLLMKLGIAMAFPIIFTIQQPDFGTSLVFVFITGVIIILSGINWRIIGVLLLSTLLAMVAAVFFVINFPNFSENVLHIKPYQMKRVLTWFDASQQTSDDTYQIDRSLEAIGSGQLNGKGISGLQVLLPEAHTDFIFSVVGESFGFIGSAAVILLYFLLLYKLVSLGVQVYQHNKFGAFICFGYMSLILMHTFQNIGMTLGIMPITGIPLLLLSYGGSSTLLSFIGFGLVYRVAVENSVQNEYLFK